MHKLLLVIIIFFCQVGLALPSQIPRPWPQEAIGVPEGHKFIKKLADNGFSFFTPKIGILDIGFDVTSIPDTKLTKEFRKHLFSSSFEIPDLIYRFEHFFGNRSTEQKQALVDIINRLNAILIRAGLDLKQRNHVLLQCYRYYLYHKDKFYKNLAHGTAVAHLIAGKLPVSVSDKGEIDFLFPFMGVTLLAEEIRVYKTISSFKPSLDIINISQIFSSFSSQESDTAVPAEILAAIRKIAKKTILVTSVSKRKLAAEIITVGSINAAGCVSSFSASGELVTICAPSDRYLQTTGKDENEFNTFTSTSGAAALVTGALADVLSILGSLQIKDAIYMLEKTAITRVDSNENNVKSLNYYKLLRVAERLVAAGWPERREILFTDAVYDFTDEVNTLLVEIIESSSVEESFAKLREVFFLDSDNIEAKKRLAKIYAQAGYETQAIFYSGDFSGRK